MAGALNTSHLLGALGFQVVAINGIEVNGLPSGGVYNGLNFLTAGASAALNPQTKAVDITLPAGGGGGGTPGGTLGMVQFYDGADFAGASDLIWTPGSRLLDVGGTAGTLLRAANASGDGFAPLELRNVASDAVPILRLNGTGTNGANVQFHSGTRNPSGVVPGNTGDIYVQSVIGTGAANLWQNTGTGTTSTWTQFATGSATGDVVGPASSNPMDGTGTDDLLTTSGAAVGIPVFADASGKLLAEFSSVNGGVLRAIPGNEGPGLLEWSKNIEGFWVEPQFSRDLGDAGDAATFYTTSNAVGDEVAKVSVRVGHRAPDGVIYLNAAGIYFRDNDGAHNRAYLHRGNAGDLNDNTGNLWHEIHAGPDIDVDSVTATGDVAAATVTATGEITADAVKVETIIDLATGAGPGVLTAKVVAASNTLSCSALLGGTAVEVDELGRVGFSRNQSAGAVVRAHAPHIVGVRTTDAADIADQLRETLASMGLIIDFTTAA